MKKTKILPLLVIILAVLVWFGFRHQQNIVTNDLLLAKPVPDSIQSQDLELPKIEPFMLQNSGQPANWLGELLIGKELIEPINVVIIDRLANSKEEAIKNLDAALNQADFPARTGHSTDYLGKIEGISYQQLPQGKHLAYSDAHFELDNNHGRIFGPHFYKNKYYFIGAFSRENIKPSGKVKHRFDSFNRARDKVAKNLEEKTPYAMVNFVQFNNYLINHASQTTGDHDGMAVVLSN